jgi:ribosomal protein RSM22 (predicted rRNA methylase)
MVKEIKFLVTGEVRRPKKGDWFLSAKGVPICAAQDFNTSQYPILKMEVVEDNENRYMTK